MTDTWQATTSLPGEYYLVLDAGEQEARASGVIGRTDPLPPKVS